MKAFLNILSILLLFFPGFLSAQKLEDVIYLSDGSIIRGIILEDSSGSITKILNHAGDVWAFNTLEIDSVKREKPFEYKALKFNQPGMEYNINAELLMRSNTNAVGNAVIPGLIIGAGYRFCQYFTAGADFGMEFYEQMAIPVSVSLRVKPSSRALSPFVILRTGYTLPTENRPDDWDFEYDNFGGIHYTIGGGLEKIMNENTSFLFTFSYHYQELRYHLSPLHQWVQERDRTEAYSRFRITLGYVFR